MTSTGSLTGLWGPRAGLLRNKGVALRTHHSLLQLPLFRGEADLLSASPGILSLPAPPQPPPGSPTPRPSDSGGQSPIPPSWELPSPPDESHVAAGRHSVLPQETLCSRPPYRFFTGGEGGQLRSVAQCG